MGTNMGAVILMGMGITMATTVALGITVTGIGHRVTFSRALAIMGIAHRGDIMGTNRKSN